MPQKLT